MAMWKVQTNKRVKTEIGLMNSRVINMRNALILTLFAVLLVGCAQQGAQAPTSSPAGNEAAAPAGPGTGNDSMQTGGSQAASPDSVTILNFAYDPETITVPRGTTVTWTNNDPTAHTVTGNGFDSGSIGTGETYSHTFNDAGTFAYGCTFHPNMHGTVVVQ